MCSREEALGVLAKEKREGLFSDFGNGSEWWLDPRQGHDTVENEQPWGCVFQEESFSFSEGNVA